MRLNEIDKKLLNLIEKTVSISEDTLRESGQLPPVLLLVESDGRESMHRFVDGNIEDLKLQAQNFIEQNSVKIQYCALGYDGSITIRSGKNDAIIIIGYSKDEKYAFVFAERYLKNSKGLVFENDVSFIDQDRNLLLT